jgi:hypothetical protein
MSGKGETREQVWSAGRGFEGDERQTELVAKDTEMNGERMSKGRLLTSVATLTAVGGFLADWNRTHLLNPNPSARGRCPG